MMIFDSDPNSRREFLAVVAAGAAAMLGCGSNSTSPFGEDPGGGSARLTARPGTPSTTVAPGSTSITAGTPTDGVLVVPSSYTPSQPMPLVLGLHGAAGTAAGQVNLLGALAESQGFVLLAVGARGITWDVISSRFSYDVAFIDDALAWAFERCAVDPTRIAVEGFSDGASYALGLGLANGDLFTRIIAFSPGFIPRSDSPAVGKPRVFDSHGTQDTVLRIDNASRRIVPMLRDRGHDVTYVEFNGGHGAPPEIVTQAIEWLVA